LSALDLKRFVVFADLSDEECREVASLLEQRTLGPGETLFEEGEEADGLLLVAGGSLELRSRRCPDRARLGVGGVLGGLSLFCVGAREATAAAAERARVFVLRRASYRRLAEDNPRAACRIAEAVAAEAAALARQVVAGSMHS
jgi:CRP-like cAMP-binding protein